MNLTIHPCHSAESPPLLQAINEVTTVFEENQQNIEV